MIKKLFPIVFLCFGISLKANSQENQIILKTDSKDSPQISKNIYGHFAEHLGRCIYDGFWVSDSLNVRKEGRIRLDVVDALKKIKIPNLRWPGGCFADEYHWRDGIGVPTNRPKMVNTNWGGVVEDNSFGTHEFLKLCELLGTEPYIAGNVGSGTVQEMSNWVEYLNFDGVSPMADLRTKNGRKEPWNVTFWGVGNESWGCGGNMTPEYYSDLYKRYASFAKSYSNAPLKKIASGANSEDYNWTEVLMKRIPRNQMWGLTLHYYVIPTGHWGDKGSATAFTEKEYFETMKRCLKMEEIVTKHSAIMDKYDPQKKVALVVDEWGIWTNVEPGTNPGFLYQQNSLRDALIAATTLNIFNNHSDRVRMANLAQTVNVLQSVILTKGNQMVLTPTYHVFDLFKVHQDATLIPVALKSEDYKMEDQSIPALNVSASKDRAGKIHITLVNLDPNKKIPVTLNLGSEKIALSTAQILTSGNVTDVNTFEQPNKLHLQNFNGVKINKEGVMVDMPAKSVVMIELSGK